MQKLGYNAGGSPKERGHTHFDVVGAGNNDVILEVPDVDDLDVQVVWDGTITATITIAKSNSYIPNPSDRAGTPVRVGTFTDVTTRYASLFTNPAGSPGSADLDIGRPGACFVRVRVAVASGAGNLDLYASGKSYR
jgi:hypothetical protein